MIADVRWVIFGFRFCSFGRNVNRLWSLIWAFFINYVTLEGGGWCLKIEINLRMPPWWRLRKVFWDDLWFYCQQQKHINPWQDERSRKVHFPFDITQASGHFKENYEFPTIFHQTNQVWLTFLPTYPIKEQKTKFSAS